MAASLAGRHALVTGGGSGIGRAVAQHLARDGAAVTVLDLDGGAARAVAEALVATGARAHAVVADVSDAAAVAAAVADARRALGAVHVLVCCAGIAGFAPLLEMTAAQWERACWRCT